MKVEGKTLKSLKKGYFQFPEFQKMIKEIIDGNKNEVILEHEFPEIGKIFLNIKKIHRTDTNKDSLLVVYKEVKKMKNYLTLNLLIYAKIPTIRVKIARGTRMVFTLIPYFV